MRKSIKDYPGLLKFNKSILMFMGILTLFQVFALLMRLGEQYSQEYFLDSLLHDWVPGFVIVTFCAGWLVSWKSLERIGIVKDKRALFIVGLIWIIPLFVFGFYSAIVWNYFMLRDVAGVCLMGYLSGFFIRLSLLDMATAQNFQAVLWQA